MRKLERKDCGVFMLEAFRCYFKGETKIKENIDVDYVRNRIIVELKTGILI